MDRYDTTAQLNTRRLPSIPHTQTSNPHILPPPLTGHLQPGLGDAQPVGGATRVLAELFVLHREHAQLTVRRLVGGGERGHPGNGRLVVERECTIGVYWECMGD